MSYSYKLTENAKIRLEKRRIALEWIEKTLFYTKRIEPDKKDPELLCALATIPEFHNRILKVVYKPTQDTLKIITFYFDNSMKRKL